MTTWFDIAPGEDYFCVVGSPIEHSKSPEIHQAFARQTGRSIRYDKVRVLPGELDAALAEFRALGGRGMNVTLPLKEEAYRAAAIVRARARVAEAANTLWFGSDGKLVADNTDGVGLIRDLVANHGFVFEGKRVLLVGAGGAARGALPSLLQAGPAAVTVVNRTCEKGHDLARRLADLGPVSACSFAELAGDHYDLIINATSLGLEGGVPPVPATAVTAATWCYDLMYGAAAIRFLSWCRQHGAPRLIDGLGMLVEQAAEAFFLWHAVRPQTAAVIESLRAAQRGETTG